MNLIIFFKDNYKEKKEFTRASMIREKIQKILDNLKYINKIKKMKLLQIFQD